MSMEKVGEENPSGYSNSYIVTVVQPNVDSVLSILLESLGRKLNWMKIKHFTEHSLIAERDDSMCMMMMMMTMVIMMSKQ